MFSTWLLVRPTRLPELLGETEVDEIDEILSLAGADDEVARLDVTVDESALVNTSKPLDHLPADCVDRLNSGRGVQTFEQFTAERHHQGVRASMTLRQALFSYLQAVDAVAEGEERRQ